MVGKTGFEPATPWSQTKCSTKLSHFPIKMVRSKGFEPLTFWFVAKHSIQLSYERIATLCVFNKMVAPAGIEPATQGFSVLCSTDWAMEPKKMAVPTRIELAIFCVTGRRDNRYTTEPFGCGRWIWTNDLWVMSPTSYQAALSRDINKQPIKWRRKRDSNPRAVADLPVFKTGPFNQTWVFLQNLQNVFDKIDYNTLYFACQ